MNDLYEIIHTFMQIATKGFMEADRDASIIKLEVDGLIEGEEQSVPSDVKTYTLTEKGKQLVRDIKAF